MIENALLCGAVPTSNVALGFDSSRAKARIRVNGVAEAPSRQTGWRAILPVIAQLGMSAMGQ